MKLFFTLLLSAAALILPAAEIKYQVESMKMEGYYHGGFLRGTEKNPNAVSNIPAKKNSWNEIKSFHIHNNASALSDGVLNYGKGCVKTYGCSGHHKRITFVLDIGKNQYVDQAAVFTDIAYRSESIEYSCGIEDKDGKIIWSKPEKFIPKFDLKSKNRIFPLSLPVKKEIRKLKIVCANFKPICLIVFELKLHDSSPLQIVTPDQAYPAETFAAKELQLHLAKAGYGQISILPENHANAGCFTFYIGRAGAKKLDTMPKLSPGGFILRSIDNGIVFAGNDTSKPKFEDNAASAYAVYEFLEREFNARWPYPGNDGIVIHKGVKKNFAKHDFKWETPFSFRVRSSMFLRSAKEWYFRAMRPTRSNRQYVDDIGHAFTKWHRQYGTTHPDWFARPSDKVPDKVVRLTAMCVSNEGFQNELVARWLKAREKNPGVDFFINCLENDTEGNCKCSKCMSWNGKQRTWSFYPTMMDTSNRYAKFYRSVYDKAAKYDPSVVTLGYAYANYPFAPTDVKLHPNNLILVVTPSDHIPYPYTPRHRKEMKAWAEGWKKSGASIAYRPNIFNGYVMPENTVRDFYDEITSFIPVSKAIMIDGPNDSFATAGPQCYVAARIAVNPKAKLEDLLNEYYNCFGAAAPAIKEYWEYWEKYTCDNAEKFYDIPKKYNYGTFKAFFGFNYAWYAHRLFPQEVFAPAFKILAKAEKLAANSPEDLKRVQFLKKGLENAKLTAKTCEIFVEEKYSKADRMKALNDIRRLRKTLPPYTYSKFIAESAYNEKKVWSFSDFDPDTMIRLPLVWKLKLDPKNIGEKEKFQLQDISKWQDVKTDRSLENSGHTETEFSWFGLDFTIPDKFKGKRTELALGGVDESCRVWVNGQYVGSYNYDAAINPDSYKNPLLFDITRFLKPGNNRVIVKVINYIGHGGLWKPSRLQFYEPDSVYKIKKGFRRHQEKLETIILGLGKTAFLVDEKPDGTSTLKIIGGPGIMHSRYSYYHFKLKNLANRHFKFTVEAKLDRKFGKGGASVYIAQYNNKNQWIGKINRLDIPPNKEWQSYSAIQPMHPDAVSAKLVLDVRLTDARDAGFYRNFTIEETTPGIQ
ncbi:MAG: DUF4838 domain-containing protein [Lentisphaeria bacterium]|nr:DUF4838 domain-containing protein [Lentisphaeria bacterium]